MSRRINLLSISGGKDSTAMLLLAIERGVEFRCCFADTGHEHPDTYEYLDYLEQRLGVSIIRAKADFAKKIEGKRAYIEKHWFNDLTTGRPGKWVRTGDLPSDAKPPKPPTRLDRPAEVPGWKWVRARAALSPEQANAKIELALSVLHPTGNPFLDMCVWNGRFPRAHVRFCTDELKTIPITEQVVIPILRTGMGVRSWQGVRRDESRKRAAYPVHQQIDLGVWVYRPILDWTAQDVFAMHRKHGIKPNPLYLKGMNRVGCMPCIMSRKGELAEIGRRFPDVLDRLRKWEEIVSNAGKRDGAAAFFDVRPFADDRYNIHYSTHGIDAAYAWSRGGGNSAQFDLFGDDDEIPACASNYGLCELEDAQ